MIIQHNMIAMNNCRIGKQLQTRKSNIMEKLSSGYRINRAADDAAGLAISEKMNARIRSLSRCQSNIEEGISLTQTADGALHEVNNMLNRVSELCVQAANDTNTTEDRNMIAEEITQIYDDMDRIFETTEFNTIPVFRHDGDNFYGPKPNYNYNETITELSPGDLHQWGTGAFPTRLFDTAKVAQAATATLSFGKSIDVSDVTSLNGTSFTIREKNGTTRLIQFGTAQSTGSTTTGYYVNTSSLSSVQAAFDRVNQAYTFIDKATVSQTGVTFTFYTPDTKNTFVADGNSVTETLPNGSAGNGYTIYSDGNVLDPVDSQNNTLTYSTTVTQSLALMKGKADDYILTADEIANIKQNKLQLSPSGSISFATDIAMDTIVSAGDLRRAVASALDAKANYDAVYNDVTQTIDITLSGCSDTSKSFASIYESTSKQEVGTDTTLSPSITVTQTQIADSETPAKFVIHVDDITDNNPYSFKLNGATYVFYNESKYASIDYNEISASSYLRKTTDTTASIYSVIKSYFSSSYRSRILEDGSIELTCNALNDNTPITVTDSAVTLTLSKKSETELLSSTSYYTQEYSFSLNVKESLGDSFDTTGLYGKGFMVNNMYYQFTGAGDTSSKYNDTTAYIDLTGVSTYADLCTKIESVLPDSTVVEDASQPGTLIFTKTRKTNYNSENYYINFDDGAPRGTFSGSVISSGGSAYQNPQAEIDFSQFDMDNLSDLYGTGFRITCATCPGEFINVMFCHDKSELEYPDSFEYIDDDGNKNTIHNYMVELKDVTHGSQIAANIADQLKNDLDHFTEVRVSDSNPSVLIAQDKRSADQSGRAKIMAGVYTNFLYHVDAKKIPDPNELVDGGKKGTDAYYSYCMIYAADSENHAYIPVHLPVFTVANLKLDYPDAGFETTEQITKLLKQSRTAAEVVSMARSKIGADQNRLEHALAYAQGAEEQLTAAESRIRDLDMASGITELAKLDLLSNVQQTLMTQIADQPERILSLLQQ